MLRHKDTKQSYRKKISSHIYSFSSGLPRVSSVGFLGSSAATSEPTCSCLRNSCCDPAQRRGSSSQVQNHQEGSAVRQLRLLTRHDSPGK